MKEGLDAALRYVDAPPTFYYFRAPAPGERHDSQHLATVASLAKSCILIPGNHDRFRSNKCQAGGKLFDTVFSKYWAGNKDGVVGKIISKPASAALADSLERLAIIGADGCLRDANDASPGGVKSAKAISTMTPRKRLGKRRLRRGGWSLASQ